MTSNCKMSAAQSSNDPTLHNTKHKVETEKVLLRPIQLLGFNMLTKNSKIKNASSDFRIYFL